VSPSSRSQRLSDRRHQIPGQVSRLHPVDLLGAILRQGLLGGVRTGTDEDRGRLTEAASDRQQLEGGLADQTLDVVDQDEYFSHVRFSYVCLFG